jgi:hypothetical protein
VDRRRVAWRRLARGHVHGPLPQPDSSSRHTTFGAGFWLVKAHRAAGSALCGHARGTDRGVTVA